jgi:hypothetical protein
VLIAVHNTATEWMRSSLVTSSSSSTVTACNGVLAAPQLPATPSYRPGEDHLGESVEHKTKPGASPGEEGQAGPGASQEVKYKPQTS